MSKFEFGIRAVPGHDFINKGELGLGKNSSFIQGLGGWASSNVYSLFWGTEVAAEPRDGSLTLGGYDQGLVDNLPNLTTQFLSLIHI